ncbi:MAG: TonB-dependent receptor [Bacteroidota bacterium]
MQRKTTSLVSFLLVLLFLFSNHTLCGQNLEPQPLTSILKDLETKHDVSFSYVASEISQINIVPPNENAPLNEALSYLNRNTGLRFSKINERYISVSKKGSTGANYCGVVFDQLTSLPMEGASIVVEDGLFGTVTNADGMFTIPNEFVGRQISIQFIGYHSLEGQVLESNVSCTEFRLLPSISELNEVLIQNLLVQGIYRNLNGATAIKTNNFGLLPGQTENDVLQMAQVIPGVESINETISTINTRGGSNDENLIVWEGNRMFQTGHFFGLISAFNPYLTQDVTIYKNGTPAHYGESVSGVIDLRSSDSIVDHLKGGAGINLIHANAFLEMPVSEKVGLQISGRGSNNDYFKTPVYNNYAKRIFQDSEVSTISNNQETVLVDAEESFRLYDLGLKLLWDASEKDKVRVNFLTMDNDLDFTETLVDLSQSKTSKLDQRSIAGGASWERKWSSKFSTQASIFTSYYLLEALNTDVFTTQVLMQENEVLELGAKLNTQLTLSDNFKLNSGYHFTEIGISNLQDVNLPRFRNFEKDVLISHILHGSLFFQSNNKQLSMTAGVRGNYFDKFEEVLVEPRLHVIQKLSRGFALELSGEMKSQTATQRVDFESDFLGVEKRRWVLANNEDIPIKKSKQASLGFVYNRRNWFINLEGFYKIVDGITSRSQGFQNQFRFISTTGSYEVKGVEFILNKKVKDFSGWITYAYNENDYDFTFLTPQKFPNNIDVRHSAKVAASYNYNSFKFAAGLNWRTGKPFTSPVEGEEFVLLDTQPVLQFNPPNQERLPDYFRLDLSAEYVWKISEKLKAQFNMSILNLLDKTNTLNVRYILEEDEEEVLVKRIEELSLGFTPNFSVQLFF